MVLDKGTHLHLSHPIETGSIFFTIILIVPHEINIFHVLETLPSTQKKKKKQSEIMRKVDPPEKKTY